MYGGSSDYLLPTLHASGSGCVTGLGNVFPRSVARIFDLWKEGRVEEARKLQQSVADAEWACKKGIACTKFGAWWFLGKGLGIDDSAIFRPRKPYLEVNEGMQKWTIETMRVLEETEKALPGRDIAGK